MVLLAATLVTGEALGFALSRFAGLWAWAAFLFVSLVCLTAGWKVSCTLHLIVFVAGLALAWRAESKRIAVDEYAKILSQDGRPPSFVLKVKGDAVCRKDGKGRRKVSFNSSLDGVPLKVIAPMPDNMVVPKDGELWRCAGWLALRKKSQNRYGRRTLWVMERDPLEKAADADVRSASAVYRRLSGSLMRRSGKGVEWSRELASFGNAMLLGRREGIPYGRLAVFAAAGTIHVFAISGLHVMLIAGLLKTFLKGIGLSPRMCAACAIPMLASYVMLIGAPPSAVRAALMVSLYQGACLFDRKPDSLAAWAVSAIVICGISPEMILNVGCVLSFTVMLGILLWIRWSGQFASPLDGLLRLAAIEGALKCERRKRFILSVHRKAEWLLGALGISLAAWIAGAPVAAMVFGRLALGSILLNVIVVPLAGMAVAFGVFGMAAAFILPQLGVFFNNLAALCIHMMTWLSEKTASMPLASVGTLPWSWSDCLMWYVAWFAIFVLLSRHLPRKEFIPVREWEKGDDQETY